MILNYKNPHGLCTIIRADFQKETVEIENHTDVILHRAFGVNQSPTWQDFQDFLEERCFPRTRACLKLVLRDVGVDFYDPLTIISKTQGRMAEDNQWIEIVEE